MEEGVVLRSNSRSPTQCLARLPLHCCSSHRVISHPCVEPRLQRLRICALSQSSSFVLLDLGPPCVEPGVSSTLHHVLKETRVVCESEVLRHWMSLHTDQSLPLASSIHSAEVPPCRLTPLASCLLNSTCSSRTSPHKSLLTIELPFIRHLRTCS